MRVSWRSTEACESMRGCLMSLIWAKFVSKGRDALALLQKLLTNNLSIFTDGGVKYSPMCYPSRGTVDDVLVYRLSADEYWLVVNASNKDKDLAWIMEVASGFDAIVLDESDETAEIALQGPAAASILSTITTDAVSRLRYYEFLPQSDVNGPHCFDFPYWNIQGRMDSRFTAKPMPRLKVWDSLIAAGKTAGLQPAGLGSRRYSAI